MPKLVTSLTAVVVVAVIAVAIKHYNAGCFCDEDVNLAGKVVVITGGNTGLGTQLNDEGSFVGLETTKVLAKCNATIFVGCRDVKKAQEVLNKVISETHNPNIK